MSLNERLLAFAQMLAGSNLAADDAGGGGGPPLALKEERYYTQNTMALNVYESIVALMRELREKERRPDVQIEADFVAIQREYLYQTRPPGYGRPKKGEAYFRAYAQGYAEARISK
jgi:hypothetical protein